MDSQLQVVLEQNSIDKENAKSLLKAFGMPLEEAGEILKDYKKIVVTKEEQLDLMSQARTKRLKLKEIRVSVEKKRKELKEDSLRTGRAIDGVANIVKSQIEPAEKYLEQQEKFAEIRQAERNAKIKAERTEKLMQYTDDISIYDLDSMTDDQFKTLLNSLKLKREAELAEQKRLEEERKAKEKAEREEQERIRKENEKLRAEAEAREKEQAKKDEEARIERERLEKEAEAKIAKERAERERLEAEKREREEAEARARAEAEEAERQALLSPDKDKLISFRKAIDVIRVEKLPVVKSIEAQALVKKIDEYLKELGEELEQGIKKL